MSKIFNDTVYYLDGDNLPRQAPILTRSDSVSGEVLSVSFEEKPLYSPVFGVCGLPEDETAIARMLAGMKEYITGGPEIYPFRYALEDAYLALLMPGFSAVSDWHQSKTGPRPWKQGCAESCKNLTQEAE